MPLDFNQFVPQGEAPASGLNFDQFLPQSPAVPLPPRRPVEFGGTPEPAPEPQAQPAQPTPTTSQDDEWEDQYDPSNGAYIGRFPKVQYNSDGHLGDLAKRAAVAGLKKAGQDLAETAVVSAGKATGSVPDIKQDNSTGDAELDKLLSGEGGWSRFTNPDWWVANIAHGITSSSPMMAGGILGGAAATTMAGPEAAIPGAVIGTGAGAAVQTLGPVYFRARAEGLNEEQAFDRAMKETGIATVVGGLSAYAPVVGSKITGVIKNTLAQMFVVQPGIMAGQTSAFRSIEGKPQQTLEEAAGDYATNVGVGVAMTAAHATLPGKKAETAPIDGPTAEQSRALDQTKAPEKAPAPDGDDSGNGGGSGTPAVTAQGNIAPDVQVAATNATAATPTEVPATPAPAPDRAAQISQRVTDAVKKRNAPVNDNSDDNGAPPPAAPSAAKPAEPKTVPESPDTLNIQRRELVDGKRPAMLYPDGVTPPKKQPEGMMRYKVEGVGVFDYNSDQVKAREIREAVKNGTVNELLGLGPTNKEAVAQSTAEGNPEVAVTERTPDGTEAKAAAGTTETAPAQVAALEANKAPENTVQVEPVQKVLEERQTANAPTVGDLTKLLPKDDQGNTEWGVLTRTMEEVAPGNKGFGSLTPDQRIEVARRLQKTESTTTQPTENVPGPTSSPLFDELQARSRETGQSVGQVAVERAMRQSTQPTEPAQEQPQSRTAQAAADLNRVATEQQGRTKIEQAKVPTPASETRVTEPGNRQPRVLESLTKESRDNQAAMNRQVSKNLKGAEETAEPSGGNFVAEQREARTNENNKATEITKRLTPSPKEDNFFTENDSRQAILDRAKAMVKAAKDEGIPLLSENGNIRRNKKSADTSMHLNGDMMLLLEAQALAKKAKPTRGDYVRFKNRENDLRAGKVEDVDAERRAEGDQANAAFQGDIEGKPTDTAASPEEEMIRREEEGEDYEYKSPEEAYASGRERPTIAPKEDAVTAGANKAGTFTVEKRRPRIIPGKVARAEISKELRETGQITISRDAIASRNPLDDALGIKRFSNTEENGTRRSAAIFGRDISHETTLSDALTNSDSSEFRMGDYEVPTKLFNAMRERIIDATGDMPVYVVNDVAMQRVAEGLYGGGDLQGFYAPDHNAIFISDRFFNAEDGSFSSGKLILHEGVHALTSRGILSSEGFAKTVSDMIDHVKQATGFDKSDYYGLTDPHEFLAEAFANPDFQYQLMETEATPEMIKQWGLDKSPNKGMIRNLYDSFVETIRKFIFGDISSSHVSEYNMLAVAIRATEVADQIGDVVRIANGESGKPLDINAARRTPEERLRTEFEKRGVSKEDARTLTNALKKEMGEKFNYKDASAFLDELAPDFQAEKVTAQGNEGGGGSDEAPASGGGEAPSYEPTRPGVGEKGQGILQRIRGKAREAASEFKYQLVDFHNPKFETQKAGGKELPGEQKFADHATLADSKATFQIHEFERDVVSGYTKLLKDSAKDTGLDIPRVERLIKDGLTALDARERNRVFAERDRDNGLEPKEKYSAMSTDEANQVLEGIKKNPKYQKVLDGAVEIRDRMRDAEHEALISSGRSNAKVLEQFRREMPNYVSLRGFEEGETENAAGIVSRGLKSGAPIYKAEGRESEAFHPINNMIAQARRAISTGERNKVLQSLAKFIEEQKPEGMRVVGKEALAGSRENIIPYWDNGVERAIKFDNPELAKRMAQTSSAKMQAFFDAATKVQGHATELFTDLSPEFVGRHFIFRYPAELVSNFRSLDIEGINKGRFGLYKDQFTKAADVMRFLSGREVKSDIAKKWMREFFENGGQVLSSNTGIADVTQSLERVAVRNGFRLRDLPGDALTKYRSVLSTLDTTGRFVTYARLREAGVEPLRAATEARNITVDFNRRGNAAGYARFMEPFFNVAMQTSARQWRNLGMKAGRRVFMGLVASGFVTTLYNYVSGGNDDDGTPLVEKMPGYEQHMFQQFISPTGSNDVYRRPLPYTFFGPMQLGNAAAQSLMYALGVSKLTPTEIEHRLKSGLLETYTPLGRLAESWTNAVPFLGRPFVQNGVNQDWKGDPIYSEKDLKGVPQADQGKPGTDQAWKDFAKDVHDITGTDHRPEAYRQLFMSYFGAQSRLAGDPSGRIEKMVHTNIDKDKSDDFRMRNLINKVRDYGDKAVITKDDTKLLQKAAKGASLDSDEQRQVRNLEDKSGMTAKQMVAVQGAIKGYGDKVSSFFDADNDAKKASAANALHIFNRQTLTRFNALGIRGGFDK